MIYPLLKSSEKLLQKVQFWARLHRTRLGILADFRSNGEVRLIPASRPPLLDADNLDGCTLSIRDNSLIIACAQTCAQIEEAVAGFLRKAKLIGPGKPVETTEVFRRKNIRHAHEMGLPSRTTPRPSAATAETKPSPTVRPPASRRCWRLPSPQPRPRGLGWS